MELKQQFSTFPSSDQLKNGTKILIWNLTVDKETTKTEIDFEAKPNDLINRMALENAPDIQRSLISYVKIL